MLYLFDTDTLIYLVRGLKITSPKNKSQRNRRTRADRIHDRCRQCWRAGEHLAVSSITVSELEYGAQRSMDYEREEGAFRKILTPFSVLPYDSEHCPRRYGEVRWALEESGSVIGAMDLLIAAHALAAKAVLVSNNLKHFERVPDLNCENWAE